MQDQCFQIGEGKVVSTNLDVIFVVDNTISMLAEDYNGNETRITGVQKDMEYIMNKLQGARYSIITFANSSEILVPLTKDKNITMQALKAMQVPHQYHAQGSTLNASLDNMIKVLKASKIKGDRTTIVFFISDGEITNDEQLKSFIEASKYVNGGAVLGYGTTKRRLYESTRRI